MGGNVSHRNGYTAEINVTPLVDVVLVLLIIFLVIAPGLARGYMMEVPGETAAPPVDDLTPEQVVLTVDRAGCPVLAPLGPGGLPVRCTVQLDDETVAVSDLAARVGQTFSTRKPEDRVLFLVADGGLNYEAVMRIIDAAQSGIAGLRIGVVRQE
jgi:biopolymer transport protein ExbD